MDISLFDYELNSDLIAQSPCFPRDNRALGKFGDQMNYPLRLSSATDVVNNEHFQFQLNRFLEDHPEETEVLFDGVAYKNGTTQITESQQFRLAVAVAQAGRKVIVRDCQEVLNQVETIYPNLFKLEERSTLLEKS